jgi:RNA polymerase sigma-70 factor (ECF subfamily)
MRSPATAGVTGDDGEPDLELLQRWQGGSAPAGDHLARRYQARLRRFFAHKVPPGEVDELAQQTWLAMTQSRARSAELRSFRGYLFGVARHVLVGYYRRRERGVEFDPEVASLAALDPSLSRQLSLQREVERLAVALQSLPLDLQLLAEGRYVEDLSSPELAEAFGIPEGTVRSRLWRARRLLDEALARLQRGRPTPT